MRGTCPRGFNKRINFKPRPPRKLNFNVFSDVQIDFIYHYCPRRLKKCEPSSLSDRLPNEDDIQMNEDNTEFSENKGINYDPTQEKMESKMPSANLKRNANEPKEENIFKKPRRVNKLKPYISPEREIPTKTDLKN